MDDYLTATEQQQLAAVFAKAQRNFARAFADAVHGRPIARSRRPIVRRIPVHRPPVPPIGETRAREFAPMIVKGADLQLPCARTLKHLPTGVETYVSAESARELEAKVTSFVGPKANPSDWAHRDY